jgi:hypothetical protein
MVVLSMMKTRTTTESEMNEEEKALTARSRCSN